jgi:hypothetical protein
VLGLADGREGEARGVEAQCHGPWAWTMAEVGKGYVTELCFMEAMTSPSTVTECYIQVTVLSISAILRSDKSLLVFPGYRDLSML